MMRNTQAKVNMNQRIPRIAANKKDPNNTRSGGAEKIRFTAALKIAAPRAAADITVAYRPATTALRRDLGAVTEPSFIVKNATLLLPLHQILRQFLQIVRPLSEPVQLRERGSYQRVSFAHGLLDSEK